MNNVHKIKIPDSLNNSLNLQYLTKFLRVCVDKDRDMATSM